MVDLKVTDMIETPDAAARATRAVVCGRTKLTPDSPAGLSPGPKHGLKLERLRCSKDDDLDLVTGFLAA
jgi:hypothetical protein